jgi:hypothetical protein
MSANWTVSGTASTLMLGGNNYAIATGNIRVKLHKSRGWNGKTGVRCSGCARFAKVLRFDGLRAITECKRCGKDEGFVGPRIRASRACR